MTAIPQKQLLTDAEVAAMLGLGRSSIWRHVRNGTLPKPITIGGSTRWRRHDLEAFIGREAA